MLRAAHIKNIAPDGAYKYFCLFLFYKHHTINMSLGVPAMGCENPNVGVKTEGHGAQFAPFLLF